MVEMAGTPGRAYLPDEVGGNFCRGGLHCGNPQHLCRFVGEDVDLERVKRRIQPARFVCAHCGRSAARREFLCRPEPLAAP